MSRFLISVTLLSLLPASAEAIDLVYRIPKGKVLRYKYRRDETCSYKAKTGKVKEVRSSEYAIEFHPREVSGGDLREFDVKFRDIKLRVVSPEHSYSFDSRKTYSRDAIDKNPLLGVFGAMVGESFELLLTERGSVVDVKGFTGMLGRAASRGLTGTRLLEKAFQRAFELVISDDDMEGGLDMVHVGFPERDPESTTWSKRRQYAFSGITVIYVPDYRIASLNRSKAIVLIGGKYKLEVDGTAIPKEGEIKGSASFDVKNGRLLFSKLNAFIKLPNVSLSSAFELKFLKVLDRSEVGPESFEKKLRGLQKLIERRTVKTVGDLPAPIYLSERCKKVIFFACNGDVIRVVEKRKGEVLRIVTALGREGWMLEKDSEVK